MKRKEICEKDKRLICYMYINTNLKNLQIAELLELRINYVLYIIQDRRCVKKNFNKPTTEHVYDYINYEPINKGHNYNYYLKKNNLKVFKGSLYLR